MTIRRRTWTTASGEPREALVVDVQVTGADGRIHRARRVAPVQTRRAAELLERRLRAELLVDAGLGDDPDAAAEVGTHHQPDDDRPPTLAAFASDFLEHHRAKGNKPSELDAKRQILRDHLVPSFGALHLDQITTRLVDAYKAQKQRPPEAPPAPKRARPDRPPKTDRGRAALRPHTVNNHLTVLRALLNLAARWDLIARVPSFQMVKEDVRDPEYLTFDETRRLLAAAPPQWQTFLLVAVGTGLRVSELRALHWTDVDLERRRIRVSRNLTRAGESSPKSRRPRTVPLGGDLVEALQVWQTRQGQPGGELVFCQGDGGALTPGQVRSAIEGAAKAAGIPRGVRPGVLRHTFATQSAMAGVPMNVVQAWMGHSDLRVTMRYAHVAEEMGQGLADLVASAREKPEPNAPPTPKPLYNKSPASSRGSIPGSTRRSDDTVLKDI